MNIFNGKEMTTKNLKMEKGNFLWFKLFVEVLIRMKDNERAHHDLVNILYINYPLSDFVTDFAQNYTPDKAVEWLTRHDSCLLRELNKALRQQHLDHLFIFRYLIKDIYEQLKKEHSEEIKNREKTLTLYRCQVISEFEHKQLLEANKGEHITINSFMSTSDEHKTVINFLKPQCQVGLKRILFEIEVDYRIRSSPFARIHGKEQDFTLFMLGCVFCIDSIVPDNTLNCYILKLKLCGDDDSDFKSILDYYMTKNFIQPETDMITLGSLLYKMGELDKARKYFELLLSELNKDHPDSAYCLDGLGNIENAQGRLKEALKYHQQALKLRTNSDLSPQNHSLIALSHIYIANDYKDMEDYDNALENVAIARSLLQQQNSREDQAKVAACHAIIGDIRYEQENCEEALREYQIALEINKQQDMPDDHPDLASIYQNMGLCRLNSGASNNNPSLALNYFMEALKIRLKALPDNHLSMGITHRSIGLAYEQLKEYQNALEFYQKANIVYKALNKNSNELRNLEDDIKRIQENLLNISSKSRDHYRTQRFNKIATADTTTTTSKTKEMPVQHDFREALMQTSNVRIILFGRSSTVKDLFGNTLLAQENYFLTQQDSSSLTHQDENYCLVGFREFYGRMLMVVDTPSFVITNDSSSMICNEIKRSIELTSPGPHAFLLVLEFISSTSYSEEEDKQFCELIINTFGHKALQYTIFVFTNLEKLQVDGIEIDRYMKNHQSPSITKLMKKCKNRYIAINNEAPLNAKTANIAELILIIDRMLKENGGREYRRSTI
ncbi:unnamed protein product [Rotaria sp. Silwood2]|nr:unnamed protein product [Rotaria sp. Silwood2]CAF3211061.1 unnamed protein product [Rotaria sp. Silwood2]CAF3502724.1 unnamed protein product [Rotaria sp. Silwood2]CAF4584227.1 unnamed protein product [Rotaria sp. Silwood2]